MPRRIPFLLLFICLCAGSAASQSSNSAEVRRLCNRVSKIKELPVKADLGGDATYAALIRSGEAVVRCLVEKVTDTTPMPDPRCPPISRTTVGDVAYFVLTDITKLDFMELLPPDIQRRYETVGASAYDEYIRRKGARQKLQLKLRAWYRQKHPSTKRWLKIDFRI